MLIKVEVKAEAREEKVESQGGDLYLVHVKAPRSKGKANQAVLKALKRHFGRQARLVSGATSTSKLVEISEE